MEVQKKERIAASRLAEVSELQERLTSVEKEEADALASSRARTSELEENLKSAEQKVSALMSCQAEARRLRESLTSVEAQMEPKPPTNVSQSTPAGSIQGALEAARWRATMR